MPMSRAHADQSPLPRPEVLPACGGSAHTLSEWEFELRRRSALGSAPSGPQERIAALLLAISQNNAREGRDPRTIPDALTCGFVAELLGLNISDLEGALVDLQRQGLVAASPASGLVLVDLDGLGRLSEGNG